MTRPKISLTSDGVGGSVTVDDVDISGSVRSATVDVSANRPTFVGLDVFIDRLEVNGELETRLPRATHQALVALGWTPPP